MPSGAAERSNRLLAILLTPHRVLCLKMTCTDPKEFVFISSNCCSLVSGIQFISLNLANFLQSVNDILRHWAPGPPGAAA